MERHRGGGGQQMRIMRCRGHSGGDVSVHKMARIVNVGVGNV